MQQVNFEPLSKTDKVGIDSGSTDVLAIRNYFASKSTLALGLGVVAFLVIVAGAYIVLGDMGFDISVFVGVVFVAVLLRRLSHQKMLAWREFAKANGWEILAPISSKLTIIDKTVPIPASISRWIRNYRSTEIISGGLSLYRFYLYSCISNARDDRTNFTFTVISIPFKQELPKLLLVGKKISMDGISRDGLDEKLELEGDFNKYFRTFINKGSGVNALIILSPDVMEVLIQEAKEFIIDFSNQCLNILVVGDYRNTKELPNFIKSAFDIAEQINQNIH